MPVFLLSKQRLVTSMSKSGSGERNMNDAINGIFELGMSIMLLTSLRRLWRDKCVKGWSINAVLWPTAWGFWNLYYYPSLGQWWSFCGGLAVVLVNSIWIGLALYFQSEERKLANWNRRYE
jgi:hypothetical protein